jgi:hypothetical protein
MPEGYFTTADKLPRCYHRKIDNWLFEKFWLDFYGIEAKEKVEKHD